ncbi:MAG: transcriptional regulator, partial [Deltaproteobacteria bacterium]|nr:transcriptional regulator [Deltaproteobacteria bacterium]
HRVAAARELGRELISARVVELLPAKKTLENQLYLEKIRFRDSAGLLESINLTELDQFHYLELQIREHQAWLSENTNSDINYQQAASDWYQTIYQPLVAIIAKSRMIAAFPGRTGDDLYLYMSRHQWMDGQPIEYGRGIDKLIPRDMEAFRSKMAELKKNHRPADAA